VSATSIKFSARRVFAVSDVLFPLWQVDREEYAAVCAYLNLSPNETLFKRLSTHLARMPFHAMPPSGFALFLAKPRLTQSRIARLDLATKLFFPAHPMRHVLNVVIALHECDGRGFREMAISPAGAAVWPALLAWGVGLVLNVLLTSVWLAGQTAIYIAGVPFRTHADLSGKRVLITGVSRGLGRDLLLHCLERGAAVVGTVRTNAARSELVSMLPTDAPLNLIVADLSQPGALLEALKGAAVNAESIDIAIACAGIKHAGTPALSHADVRRTFEVNLFAAVELAGWFCAQASAQQRQRALVLISSMGRWHGMHGSGGYNASKAALSIWGESVEMDLRLSAGDRFTVTIVEPGLFASGMVGQTKLTRSLMAARRDVAETIMSGAAVGKRVIRPPFWFALLTWGLCVAGRSFRSRVFSRVKR